MFRFLRGFFHGLSYKEPEPPKSIFELLESFKDGLISLEEYGSAVFVVELVDHLKRLHAFGEHPEGWLESCLAIQLESLRKEIEEITPSNSTLENWMKE